MLEYVSHPPAVSNGKSFVERFGIWSAEQHRQAAEAIAEIQKRNIEVIRFSLPDQHGLLRGKTLVADEAEKVLRDGVNITTTLFAKDTSHKTVFPVFSAGGGFDMTEMQGAADALMIPDPATFRVLPWAPHTGWFLCDAYFANGQPVPFATRHILRGVLDRMNALDFDMVTGLEVEFHVFKTQGAPLGAQHAGPAGDPPQVELTSRGYQYLTELRYDAVEPLLDLLRKNMIALGLPVRTVEVEFGPSQFEFSFKPTSALAMADNMVLFRSAVKQVCQRNGYHATFMCRPNTPKAVSSGWHMHQCLTHRSKGGNVFVPDEEGEPLSAIGRHYLAGLLAHARGSVALSTPTINGYKRYAPYSLAPDRAIWARDNRGAMLRVLGGYQDSGTRIENRVGEPAANPYLYVSSQALSGMDGIVRKLEPGPCADVPYETPADPLPATLAEALDCLSADNCLERGLGPGFVDYFCKIKRAEIARFQSEVTDWEQREYFELF